jgi:hypothetical protein
MGKIQDEACDGITSIDVDLDKSWYTTAKVVVEPMAGIKHDHMKRDFTLLPWDSVEEIVKVLEFGAAKYARDNWKKVEADRYVKAAFRHLVAYSQGEQNDKESGMPHLAHLGCCVLFLLSLEKEP